MYITACVHTHLTLDDASRISEVEQLNTATVHCITPHMYYCII